MVALKPSANQHLHGLDHLRAFAIVFVFLYHYGRIFPHPEWTNTISSFGWTGVDLFFVLSGYLISSQLFYKIGQQQAISFREFFTKRFFRIIPIYLLTLSVYFLFPSFREREALAPLWKYLTFTQNLGLDIRTQGTFSHAWSLCIEEQFYLILPLVLIALVYFKALRKGVVLLPLLFLAGFAMRLFSWHTMIAPFLDQEDGWAHWYTWMYYPTFTRLDGLLVGVSIAALFQFKPALKEKLQVYGNALLGLGLAILAGAYFLCIHTASFQASIFGFPLVALGYGVIVIGAVSNSSFLYRSKSKITLQIATLSYVLYLTHKIVIHLTQTQLVKWGFDDKSNVTFLICTVIALSVAFILHIIIEKPFMRLRDVVLKRKPVAAHGTSIPEAQL